MEAAEPKKLMSYTFNLKLRALRKLMKLKTPKNIMSFENALT